MVTNANSAFESAPTMVRGGATVVFVGVPSADIKINPYNVLNKEMKIMGSFLGSRDDAEAALTLVGEGKVKPIITECKLSDLNDIFNEMEHGKGVANRMVVTSFD